MNDHVLELLNSVLLRKGYRSMLVTQFSNGYRHHLRIIEKKNPHTNWYQRLLGLYYYPIGSLVFTTSDNHEILILYIKRNHLHLYDEVRLILSGYIDDAVFLGYFKNDSELQIKLDTT